MMEDRRVLTTVNKYWSLIAALAFLISGAVVGYLHLQWTVSDMKMDRDMREADARMRRDRDRDEREAIRTRLTLLESDVSWIKKKIP